MPMLRSIYAKLGTNPSAAEKIVWGGILVSFFFLGRGGEMWGSLEKSMKWSNLKLWSEPGVLWSPGKGKPTAASVKWDTDKTNTRANMHLFASGDPILCPVLGVQWILEGRTQLASRKRMTERAVDGGPKATALKWLKQAALENGVAFKDLGLYTLHSIRVGATTALAEGGCDEMLLRLTGRWRSNTNRLYQRRTEGTFIGVPQMMLQSEARLAQEWGRGEGRNTL